MSDLGRFYNFHRFSSGVVRCSQWCSFRGGTSGAPCWGFPVPSVPLPSYLRVLMHVGMVPVGRQSTDAFFYAPDCLSTFPSSSGRVWMHPGRGSLCTTLWWSSSMVRVCSRAACTFGVRSRSLWVFQHVPCQHWACEVLLDSASESDQTKCPVQVELGTLESCIHLLPLSALPSSASSTSHRCIHTSRAHSSKQHGWVGHDAHVNLLCVGNVGLWVPQYLWGHFQGGGH